jgi:hypothetical protein
MMLWAALCGAAVVALHAATVEFGARLGSYRSGIITVIAFAVAAAYAGRKYSLWLSARWLRWATRLPRSLALRFLVLDRLETWRAVHITIGVFAMLPFWWHIQSGRASTLELVLKSVVVLMVLSGVFGTMVEDFLPRRMRKSPDLEVRMEDVEAGFHALYVEAEEAILGHSEALVHAYLRNVRPILIGNQPAHRMLWATLTGRDPAPGVCAPAHHAATALGPDSPTYSGLIDVAERKVRLEHNEFNLRLGTSWLHIHRGLVIITAVLVTFHVLGALYFAGV